MSKERLKMMVSGIFYSKLMYCLPVFGNVHGLNIYKDSKGRSAGMTVTDCNKLQVLQNSVNRLIKARGCHGGPPKGHQQPVHPTDGGVLHAHHGTQGNDDRQTELLSRETKAER